MKSIRSRFSAFIRNLCTHHSAPEERVRQRTDELELADGSLQRELAERTRTQDKLRESEEFNRRILETANEGIWVMDGRHVTTFVNPKMADMLGYAPEEMLGKEVESFMYPEDLQDHRTRMETRHRGVAEQYERRFRHRDGREVWTQVSGTALMGEAGGFRGSFGMFTDITKRRQMEGEMKYRNTLLSTQLEASIDGILVVDEEGRLLSFNHRFVQMWGISDEVMESRSDERALQSVLDKLCDHRGFLEKVHYLYSHPGETSRDEIALADGRYFDRYSSPVIGEDGKQYGRVWYFRDITERKRMEEHLRDSEVQMRTLINAMPDIVCFKDGQGRWLLANDFDLRLFQLEGVPYKDKKDSELADYCEFYRDAFLTCEDTDELAWKSGGPTRSDETIPRPDGTACTFDIIKIPTFDADGNRKGLLVLGRDITERKQAEERLKASEVRYRRLYDTMMDAFVSVSMDGKIQECNDTYLAMLGYDADEIRNLTYQDITPEKWHTFEAKIVENELLVRGYSDIYQKEYRRKDGSVFPVELRSYLLRDNAGMPVGIWAIMRDITERKRSEEALKESERHLAEIIEFLPDATLVIDRQGRVTAWNRAMEEMTGVAATDMIGKGDYEYAVPFYGERRPILIDLVLLPKEEVERKYYHIRRKGDLLIGETDAPVVRGQKRFLSGWAHPIYDAAGMIVGAIESIRDITDRRRAEEALSESESRYRLLAESASDIIFTMDRDLRFTYISPSVARIRGYTVEEAMSQSIEEVLTPPSLELAIKAYAEELEKEKSEGVELWRKRTLELEEICKDGSAVWTETTFSPLRDTEMNFVGFQGITREITERKRSEEVLKMNVERMQTLLRINQMTEAIVQEITEYALEAAVRLTRSTVGYLAFVNPEETVLTMYSWSKAAMAQCAIMEKPLTYKVDETGLWGEAIRQRKPIITNDYDAPCPWKRGYPEGHVAIRRHMNIPVFEGPRIVLVAGVGNKQEEYDETDVYQLTLLMEGMWRSIDRKRAEDEKKRLQTQLAQAQKMESIGTLAGGIAHDFNNILSAIIGYSELALDDIASPEKARAEIGEVINAGDRARDLVSQILTFSRKTETVYSPLALRTIVKESLKMLRSMIPSTIEIRHDLADSGLVMSDPTQINQILMNLCTNAVHSMEESGGVLELKLDRMTVESDRAGGLGILPGQYLRLTVSDTGHGMPPEVIEKIFEPYFTTKVIGRGTGLGLSVVHGIVKSHGGAITCSSTPGVGTTFEVYLPKVDIVEKGRERMEKKPYEKGTERILFVDDELALVNLAEKMLGKIGYKVSTKTDSREALAVFRENPAQFDLVFTDMTMPGLSGDMLARKLLEIRGDIPIILGTGYSERISEEKAKGIGVRAFVLKPFKMTELAKTIRKVLDAKE